MGKNTKRNRKKKENSAGEQLIPSGKNEAKNAWATIPSPSPADELRQLVVTWQDVLDREVVGMMFEENQNDLQQCHEALCEISGAQRPLLTIEQAGTCSNSSVHDEEAKQLKLLIPQVREIFSEFPQWQLEKALRDCQFNLETTITALSSTSAAAPVPRAPAPEQPAGDPNNPFNVLEQDSGGASKPQHQPPKREEVSQLTMLFGISEQQAATHIMQAGGFNPAMELLLQQTTSAPPEGPQLAEDSEQRKDASVAMLVNMFPANSQDEARSLLSQHDWDFDAACSALLRAQTEEQSQPPQPPVCAVCGVLPSCCCCGQPEEPPLQFEGRIEPAPCAAQPPAEPPVRGRPEEQSAPVDAVLESLVSGLCDLFPDIQPSKAAELIQRAEYQFETAVEYAIGFISQPAQPVPIEGRSSEEPPGTRLLLSRSSEMLAGSEKTRVSMLLTEKEKMRAALRFGKLVGEVAGLDDVLLELLEKSEYNIARAFESWLALEDEKMALQLGAIEEAEAAEHRLCAADDESTMQHRNWWPQQTFPEDFQPLCSPKRDSLIQLYEFFPEEAHAELQQIFEASNRNLEESIEMVLSVLFLDRAAPPVLDSVSEMELVLVGWSSEQIECLLQGHDGDVAAALDAALSRQSQGSGALEGEPGGSHSDEPLQFLQNIFMEMPSERIEAVLSRNQGNVQASMDDLLLVASEVGGMDDADASSAAFGIGLAHKSQLAKRKMSDLTARFPHIPADVVQAVFSYNKFQMAKTVEDLAALGSDLLDTVEAVPPEPAPAEDEDGFRTIRKKPRQHKPKPGPAGRKVANVKSRGRGHEDETEAWGVGQSKTAQLRRMAMQAGMARGKLLKEATEAYRSGQKALAKQLSEQGKEQEGLMRKYHREACNVVFLQKNPDIAELQQIDLHGLTVSEAVETTANYLNLCKSMKHRGILKIITGKGLHSEGGVPKIKPAIEDWLQSNRFNFLSSPNGGVVEVAMTAKDWTRSHL
eukprot:TRINITY_DN2959_c0_g1_i3.p1 TRINITY_DN2959_c0_g1~~TRINITY_DN2959_c0_g1_i3.p1  ORF type:complete len:985 (-),score=256.33 TRINITY_DN2959_c0_g1_i3:2120-5074(-)